MLTFIGKLHLYAGRIAREQRPHVVICSSAVARGLDPRKFVHIPNAVPVARAGTAEDGELPCSVGKLIAQERARRRFLVGFAGSITVSNALETLLDAALLLSTAGVSFLIAGDGPRTNTLREHAAELGLDNFHMLGRLPKSAIQKFLAQTDALAIILRNSPLYRFGTSLNKLFDYMLAAKPILQASNASNDLVSEAQCGFTVGPEDLAVFAEAVGRQRALLEDKRCRMGENGRRFVIGNHDFQALAHRFLDAIGHAA